MPLTMRKIEVPESEVRSDLRKELEPEDLLPMLEAEFLERLERIEEASKGWAAAEERGDLVSPQEIRATRKARRVEQKPIPPRPGVGAPPNGPGGSARGLGGS